MENNPESPCPELICPGTVVPPSNVPGQYSNDAVYYRNICPSGVDVNFSGTFPSWITMVENIAIGKSGLFRGDTKEEANKSAQDALNSFINDAITKGEMTCSCSQILPAIMPATEWLAAPGLEIVNFNSGYGWGSNGAGKSWKPGSYPNTCLVQGSWPSSSELCGDGSGSGNPWWFGDFTTYPTLPLNNANPQVVGSNNVYMWRISTNYDDFCRIGRIVGVIISAVYETCQAYANPASGLLISVLRFSVTCRCVNGTLIWLVAIWGAVGSAGFCGCWHKTGGYTPEGNYQLVFGTSPPGTSASDFPEFGGASMTMSPVCWIVDQAPIIQILTQVELRLLPFQEGTASPILGNTNNFIRYLNTDANGQNGTFYMTDGSNNIYASTDGIIWSVKSAIAGAGGLTDIAYGNNVFVATSKGHVAGMASIYFSSDAISWLETQIPLSENNGDLDSIVFGSAAGGKFLACQSGRNGTVTNFHSSDGATWISSSAISPKTTVRYLNGQWVIIDGNSRIQYSVDCVNFTEGNPVPFFQETWDIAYGNFVYVAVGNGRVFTSRSLDATAVALDPENSGWITSAFPGSENIVSIAYGLFVFVAVTDAGNAYRSSDGTRWTQIMSHGQQNWTGQDYNLAPSANTLGNTGLTVGNTTIPAAGGQVTFTLKAKPSVAILPGTTVTISGGAVIGHFRIESWGRDTLGAADTTILATFLNEYGDDAPGSIFAQDSIILPKDNYPLAPIFLRSGGQYTGTYTIGSSHENMFIVDIPGQLGFPDAEIVSVTWYAGLLVFVVQAVQKDNNGNVTATKYFQTADGLNWSPLSPGSPKGSLKSVCFWKEGTFIAVE